MDGKPVQNHIHIHLKRLRRRLHNTKRQGVRSVAACLQVAEHSLCVFFNFFQGSLTVQSPLEIGRQLREALTGGRDLHKTSQSSLQDASRDAAFPLPALQQVRREGDAA